MTRLSTRRYLLTIFVASAVVACLVLSMSTAGVCQPGPQQSTAPTLSLPIQAGAGQAANAASHAAATPQQTATTPLPEISRAPANASPPVGVGPGASTASPGAVRESKETQELKEITERPRDWFDVAIAFAWPLAVIALLGIFLLTVVKSETIREFFGFAASFVRKIAVAGVELEINPEAVGKVREFVGKSFGELVTKGKDQYDRMASLMSVEQHLDRTVRIGLRQVLSRHGLDPNPENLRATVHVPDVIFRHYLYQLVNYFPGPQAGGPAGRRFSQRYGVIGQAWRLGQSIGRGRTITGPGAEAQLIIEWGMMANEANDASHQRPANLCVMLRDQDAGNLPVGILYIDSTRENAFSMQANDVAQELEGENHALALARAVAAVMVVLRSGGPDLDISRSPP